MDRGAPKAAASVIVHIFALSPLLQTKSIHKYSKVKP